MARNEHRIQTSTAILVSLVLALLLFATTGVSQAQAADYSVSDWGECGGGYNAGSFDKNGNLYVPCSAPGSANYSESTIYKVAEDGTRTAVSAPLGFHVTDVAPSPTGDFLYATVAEKVTDPQNSWDYAKNAVRLKKELDGKYVKDTGFTFKNYGFEGSSHLPHGMHIATDAHADGTHNIYLSSGAWTANGNHTVVKYKSNGDWAGVTIGKYVPGAEKDLASSWNLGRNYHNLTGLAVSPDGNRVYTTEVGNNRVQRWTKPVGSSETTAYTVDKSFGGQYKAGAQDPHIQRQAHCEQVGWSADSTFSAPYDVALTNEGGTEYLYVLNTTCQQVLKFNAAQAFNGGTEGFVATAQLGAATASTLPHGFAVSSKGNVFAGQARKMWTQPDDPTACTVRGKFGTLREGTSGNDALVGDDADDVFCAGDGNDTIRGKGDNDKIDGGGGTDTVSYEDATGSVTVDLAADAGRGEAYDTYVANPANVGYDSPLENVENVRGGPKADSITGDDGANTIYARDGVVDNISCGAGTDTVQADASDTLATDCETVYLPAPTITAPANNSYDTDGTLTFQGTAEAGSTVRLYEGTTLKGTAVAGSTGAWTKTLTGVTNGKHSYAAKVVNKAGTVVSAPSATRTITVDMVKPKVAATTPLANATGVSVGANVTVTFSEAMNPNTITTSTVKLVKAGTTTAVPATVTYYASTKKAQINPHGTSTSMLAKGTKYTATVTTVVKDLAGNQLDQDPNLAGAQSKSWSFTTAK